MNVEAYYNDLSKELEALQNRVRNFIGAANWGEEGRWKESILRSVLKRYLPSHMNVGTGFIVTPKNVSTQIDVLIYDTNKPTLFKDGDFVIIMPEVALAVIEVKTGIEASDLKSALSKLNEIGLLVKCYPTQTCPFLGFFAFDQRSISSKIALEALSEYSQGPGRVPIHAMAFGNDHFVRFWKLKPDGLGREYDKWHAYKMQSTAFAYFITNVIMHLCPPTCIEDELIWFPSSGKEMLLEGIQGL